MLRKLASMQGVGRGTTDQPPALNTNLLPSGAQQQQSSATVVPFYPNPVPGQSELEHVRKVHLNRQGANEAHYGGGVRPTQQSPNET